MKIREIFVEFKKGVKAVKHNKKSKDPAKEFAKAKEKLEPVKPMEEGVTERIRDPEDWDEGNKEPGNNFAVYINGRQWKVFPGPYGAYADSPEEEREFYRLKSMARRKSEQTGKKWEVYKTGERATESIKETATPGATSAGNVAVLGMNPKLSPGPARGKKSYIGSPGKSGTKAPPQPKVKQPKSKYGTAKNALDMKHNIFGGGAIKRK